MSNSIYSTLETTAKNFIQACCPAEPGSNTVRSDLILSHCTPDFQMSYGHKHFVSTFPPLQAVLTGPEWQQHMLGMTSNLRTWDIEIMDMTVDAEKKKVVARGDFHMTVKGFEDAIINDIILLMRMDGEGSKLVSCMEFIDPAAGQELGKRMATVAK